MLIMDQFSGHLTNSVLTTIMKTYRFVPIVCWGGLTGLAQVADVYQNRAFKTIYKEEESKALSRYIKASSEWAPRLTRGDVLWCVSRTWRRLVSDGEFLPKTKLCFKRTGSNLKLGGSEGALLDSAVLPYWGKLGMKEWRANFLQSAADGEIPTPKTPYELVQTFEIHA